MKSFFQFENEEVHEKLQTNLYGKIIHRESIASLKKIKVRICS